ncbi:MAG: tryptophan synthase subunit alpha [Actinobacteria bacterium]|nr:tryptophan synthase subunit alpha [Actinomycetota bacterium]
MNQNRWLSDLFTKTKSENRAALIGYLPAGYPNKSDSIEYIKAMIAGGVDAIEVGFPYSDPVMDGPVIQQASEISLQNKVKADDVLRLQSEVAKVNVPAIVMSYWNPIEKYGVAEFLQLMQKNHGAAVITPDLTIDESTEWISQCRKFDINSIFVVAPNTSDARLEQVTKLCTGFIYAASIMGVTGTRNVVSNQAQQLVNRIRKFSELPVAVGLGVSNRDQAKEVAKYADGVIVGSAFVKLILENTNKDQALTKVKQLAKELSEGVRNAR